MKISEAAAALTAIAHESRLEIFRMLVKRGPDGYSPGELAEKLAMPGPTLSFHLKELYRSGLIRSRKQSRYIYYSPNFDCVNGLVEFLTEHCCSLSSGDYSECKPAKLSHSRRKISRKRLK